MAGIYIHIPFCKQACFYCDFHFSTSLKKKDELINSLVKELELRKTELKNQTIETIYFGGGTPSLLANNELRLLIDSVYKNYTVSENPEITLEANPDDLSKNQIIELSKSPINRLSIGIQSFFEDDLQSMNRAHNQEEAKQCLVVATQYFDNISIDLIYGIPGMSNQKWRDNLQMALNFGVNHISSYALTVEPKTALASFIKQGKYPPVEEQLAHEHFKILAAETKKHGFIHYETSNFGKENYFSKHNTSYWQGKPYIGIGPSAHSFNGNIRNWNIANNAKYIESISQNKLPNTSESLSKKDQFNEYIMIGLRTIWGISLEKIEVDFGLEYKEHVLASAKKHITEGLLVLTSEEKENNITSSVSVKPKSIEKLRASEKGKFLVDGLASHLFMI